MRVSVSETPVGRVYTEQHDHILKIVIGNVKKKNAFSPEMMAQLSDALTLLENQEDLWVGVLCANGDTFTAGFDMPKFFGPKATVKPDPEDNIDPFGLANQCTKPIVTAVQGICYTIGIELMLSGDIVAAASDARFCQMEAKRGIAPLGGAHFRYTARAGWGKPGPVGFRRLRVCSCPPVQCTCRASFIENRAISPALLIGALRGGTPQMG